MSVRAIAREVGMNPASLYTYFASLDEIFTALLLQSFERLAAAVTEAHTNSDGQPAIERGIACAEAYRQWALAHPAQFNLLFTDAIPEYAAPDTGGTLEAEVAIWLPILTSIRDVIGLDHITEMPTDLPPGELTDEVFGLYGMMHVLVMLEINHHVPPNLDMGAVLHNQTRAALERMRDRTGQWAER